MGANESQEPVSPPVVHSQRHSSWCIHSGHPTPASPPWQATSAAAVVVAVAWARFRPHHSVALATTAAVVSYVLQVPVPACGAACNLAFLPPSLLLKTHRVRASSLLPPLLSSLSRCAHSYRRLPRGVRGSTWAGWPLRPSPCRWTCAWLAARDSEADGGRVVHHPCSHAWVVALPGWPLTSCNRSSSIIHCGQNPSTWCSLQSDLSPYRSL